MYQYNAGISDTDYIRYCPNCGEEITTFYSDGMGECDKCNSKFAVIYKKFEGSK